MAEAGRRLETADRIGNDATKVDEEIRRRRVQPAAGVVGQEAVTTPAFAEPDRDSALVGAVVLEDLDE